MPNIVDVLIASESYNSKWLMVHFIQCEFYLEKKNLSRMSHSSWFLLWPPLAEFEGALV